ncbi:hypothetical protein SAMN05660463_01169 [Pseudomonas sp. URIL14HWK12:I9]|nr:hypothetical protein F474_02181 [Pseudomonas sp. URIL14HWK12:I12]PVZ24778.1 hypothetical protein F470_01836 [Pseudomonas sp. URIL14HWK12:I10]PVZ34624.1 hypothetical protein F472_02182 [Pseudomonas sp. URIL14HWK12:I11]SNZ08807.1 hypothetical protein SAMN05660463_01169 [Pseudomonas sp. URIL14HWK12:I9]
MKIDPWPSNLGIQMLIWCLACFKVFTRYAQMEPPAKDQHHD